jgi:hypothetical protein
VLRVLLPCNGVTLTDILDSRRRSAFWARCSPLSLSDGTAFGLDRAPPRLQYYCPMRRIRERPVLLSDWRPDLWSTSSTLAYRLMPGHAPTLE